MSWSAVCRSAYGADQPARHARIERNASEALRRAIAAAGAPCEAFDARPGMAVSLEGEECRIPDVALTCAAAIDETARLVPEPMIVVEVASPSTRLADVNDKSSSTPASRRSGTTS